MQTTTRDTNNAAFWKAIGTAEPPSLGPGPRRNRLSTAELRTRLTPFNRSGNGECNPRSLLEAVALLYHDHHDLAHDLVQDLACQEGVLIHAILHRREPDYWNAKYWFRRVTDHPMYRSLTVRLQALESSTASEEWMPELLLADSFDPISMVDACEKVEGKDENLPAVTFLREVQQMEFECLVEHLLANAGQ